MRSNIPLLILIASLGGCLPITLSLAPDGRSAVARSEGIFILDSTQKTATVIHECQGLVRGAWAVFDGQGKTILYATHGSQAHWDLYVRSLTQGAKSAKILSGNSRLGYARLSPDGQYVSVVTAPTFGKPTLSIHQAQTGKELGRVANVSTYHAWTLDSQALYIMVAHKQDSKQGIYQGRICRVGIGGKTQPLFSVATKQSFHLDFDPKSKKIAVVGVGANVDPEQPAQVGQINLFLYAAGKLSSLDAKSGYTPRFAIFSPSGKQILINSGGAPENLLLLDAGTLKLTRTLAKDVPVTTESLGDNATILPTWSPDGGSIIFWRYLPTMGLNGKSLRTRTLDLETGKERDLENRFESAIYKALGR